MYIRCFPHQVCQKIRTHIKDGTQIFYPRNISLGKPANKGALLLFNLENTFNNDYNNDFRSQ